MARLNQIYRLLIAGIFMLSLLLPLLVYVFSVDAKKSHAEKRTLLPFPIVRWAYDSLVEFPKEFDAYYQDHFGFRDALITLHNSIKLNIFGVSPSPMVIKGKEGWFFYIGAGDIAADFYGLKQADFKQLDDYSQVLLDRRDWLASMGISYIFVPVPNKISVYKDKLPTRIQGMYGGTFYQQFLDYLGAESGNDQNSDFIVNVGELLAKKKSTRQVYFRTDTHWNHFGALETFNQIIRQLKNRFPQLTEISDDEMILTEVKHAGDLLYLMHVENKLSEQAVMVSLKSPCPDASNYKTISAKLIETLPGIEGEENLPKEGGCKETGLTALVINDSFGAYLQPYFDARFERVIYSTNYDFNMLQDLIMVLRPDVVIDQRVSRNLNRALAHDRVLEDRAIQIKFEGSSESVFDLMHDDDAGSIEKQHDVLVKKQVNANALIAKTNDPYITVSVDRIKKGKRYNMMIELTAPDDTVIEIFYKPVGTTNYRARNKIARKISKGFNRLYLHLPNQDIERQIRIDPGKLPVIQDTPPPEYILHSFIVKTRE